MGILKQIKTEIAVAKILRKNSGSSSLTIEPFGLEYKKITDNYFSHIEKIKSSASVLYNLKITEGPKMDELINLCYQNINEYRQYKKQLLKHGMQVPLAVPAYERLAIIYERQKEYEKAINICIEAINEGCHKSTYSARIARLIRKMNIEDISLYEKYL